MGDSKLCLLLLLTTSALAFAQYRDPPTCLLAQRFKTLHKYEYQYEAESLNSVDGASQLKNGPKASCKVEVEAPQTCSFIVRTTGCTLSEAVDTDAEGNPVFSPAANSDAFAADMEKYFLKVVVDGEYDVKLYPENGETTTILNFKRGIISALIVPLLEEDKNNIMPTIHGLCTTLYTVNAREDIATDVSLDRDLSRCNKFVPIKDHSSPLALITGMHYPLSQLVRSTQTCNYKFDNDKKHMTSGSCTENHLLIPFSHKGKYGVNNVGKQVLTLVQVSPHNDRVFEPGYTIKFLDMEAVDDKSAVQDKDAALNVMRELVTLSETEGEKRAHLFHSLISTVRGMKTETLRAAIPEAVSMSRFLTYQVLTQCGTPECSSAIMMILRTFDTSTFEVDAAVFALGLMSNPSALLISDMLEMAKYKPSQPIMFALSNVVKRFYNEEGKLIPEIYSVAEFMASQLGDCTGEKDQTFMTLRVVGNMALAVIPPSPDLQSAVFNCMKQPAASQQVQQAAIQVYRQISPPTEEREVFMQVLLDNSNPVQERIAAYLILMKNPQLSELTQLNKVLSSEDGQVKSFIISHITNILSSTDSNTQELKQKIQDALQGNEIKPTLDPIHLSRNYKMGSLQGNMIFEDGVSYLPKEVMLAMTLKAFGLELDMMEVGFEGKGFEAKIDALFGENGFFPDTALKTMYFVSDNMPQAVNEILENVVPGLKRNRMKRQTSQSLMKDIGQNLNKLVEQLRDSESPEAMIYLRLLGNELGYLRTNDFKDMTYSASMMIDNMLKMFPKNAQILKSLVTNPDTKLFAHYMFMDNEFFLPTVTGVPLRIALSGTFAPGFKGGLQLGRDMSTFTFMPSAGVEFVTQIGSHIPEYVNSGLEMHTNIFHESGIKAKISVGSDNIKLTIPAPTKPTKLIEITNTLMAVTGSVLKAVPPAVMDKVDISKCTVGLAGLKFCTDLQYINAFSQETAPYFPLTGDSKFAVELHPTGEVTEYTATVAYELQKEGEEGRQMTDSLKFILKAEGADPTEARLVMKYNRKKNIVTADVQIPDFDVETGLRLGVVDGKTKGKGTHAISLDFTNKNIPALSLIGKASLKDMKEGMLQVQIRVPSIKVESTVTANLKRDTELELELESEMKIMDATSEQKVELKYDGTKIEAEVKSDLNTKTTSLPNGELIKNYANEILDMQVGQTDMKVRHIFRKFVEAANDYMEKYGPEMLPYMKDFRLPDIPEISLPEKLFLKTEGKAVYYFNTEHLTITIPVPFGGKSIEEFNFPPALTTPSFSLPQFGLEIASRQIPIPNIVIPEGFNLSIPLLGKAEFSTMMTSNLYDVEATVAAGKDVVEQPSYSAKFDLKGTSPIDILSAAVEGTGMVTMSDSIKGHLRSAFTHKFIEAKISIEEDGTITDKLNLKSVSKIEATSPLGLNVALMHTGMAEIDTQKMSADSNFEGSVEAGPIFGKTILTQSFTIFPFRPEAKMDSLVQFDSTILKAQNTIAATFGNGEFSVVSNTNALEDVYSHVAELSFKDSQLRMKCESNAFVLGMKIKNQGEASAGAGKVTIRMETNGDHSDNRVYSLLTASLDNNGLAVNCNANIKLFENEATHKAILKMNKNGLSTSGTTTLHGPLSLENTFDADIDATRATLLVANKAAMSDIKIDNSNTLTVTLSSLDFKSNTEASASEYASYTNNIIFNLKPYTAIASFNDQLKLLDISFSNEAQLKAELYKVDLTGNMKTTLGEEEIKHTYQINYADLSTNAKCSTTAKIFGTHMTHNTELEIVGLAAKFTNDARFVSQPLRFDHNIQWSVVPFDFNLNAIFNADGDMIMYGKHSGQLYGKFQLRAQPLAFACLHECRASATQQLDNDFSLETIYDHKISTVLSPQEQKTSLRIKSKLNEHTFNQNAEVYNTADKFGIELSGTILTDILNTENKEFTLSGFIKYDKSTDSHVIQFPLIESLPVILESVKGFVVYVAETLQDFINNQEVRARLEALPQDINDFLLEIDIEDKVRQLKQIFTDFIPNFDLTINDMDAFLKTLRSNVERLLTDLAFKLKQVYFEINEMIYSSNFSKTLSQKADEVANAIDDYKPVVLQLIDVIGEMINQTDLEILKGSSIQFLHDIEVQYDIKAKVLRIVTEIRERVDYFDMITVVHGLKEFIHFLKRAFAEFINIFVREIPKELMRSITPYTNKIIQELDIVGKINYIYAKMKELLVPFEVDKMALAVLQKAEDLVAQLKLEEMTQAMVRMVKDADIPNNFMKIFQAAVNYLKTTEVKDIIEQLNMYIETLVQELKSLKYNNFVDHANQIIAEYTVYVNEIIRGLEIPKKLEATQQFVNEVLSTVQVLVERVREIKIAEIINSAMDVAENVVCDSFKRFAKYIKNEITDMDIRKKVSEFVDVVRQIYSFDRWITLGITSDLVNEVLENIENVSLDVEIISEIAQIIRGFFTQLNKGDVNIPSFTVPFTDLVLPPVKFNIYRRFVMPEQIDIPEFTILGMYKVEAITISFDDIKLKMIELIDLILNFEIKKLDVDAFFGDLTLNYLPSLPKITLPEFTLSEVTLPTIPQFQVEKLVKTLEVPEIKLPAIPDEIMVPCFGKLYGEIRFSCPFYTVKMSAAFQNSTQSKTTPIFTGFFNSQGMSPDLEILSYKLDTSTRLAFPKMKRIVLAETVNFNHVALGADHQASVTLYGLSAQAQAKTKIKVDTAPYTANLENTAFIAVEGGMTSTVDTTYTHVMNLPSIDLSNEITVTQKSIAQQEGFTYKLSADNSGKGSLNGHDFNHLSVFELSLSPSIISLSLSGDTNSPILKTKQLITAESGTLSYFKFNVRNEAEALGIKNSLFVASGSANIQHMKIEMKANHEAELDGVDSGIISNSFDFKVQPVEFVFEFQNKANVRTNVFESLDANLDLQNDYLINLSPNGQKINRVFLARLNEYKIFSNLTFDNNINEVGIFASMEGQTDLDFLKIPIDIPQFELPFAYIEAINDLNLYELLGLHNILTTTEQTINVDARILYQKSKAAPLVKIMNLIPIPSMGKLSTDFSFKSSIFNLNTKSLLFAEDDLVLRVEGNTDSVFDYLNAKLEGTTSLTTKKAIKLANSLSLKNPHIEGTHESTISLSTETLETAVSVASLAKFTLPILTLEASHNLVADTKFKVNALSTLKIKSDFNIPRLNTVGKAEVDHTLKLEGNFEYVSVESSIKSNLNGRVSEEYLILGFLDKEASLYLNENGLRSTSKVTADAKLNHGAAKVIGMDLNHNVAAEASMARVYAMLKHSSNNEANMFNFNTKGKHNFQAAIDLALFSSLTTEYEIDMTQQSNLGDLTYFEKTVAELAASKQKFSTNVKFVSPVYTTSMEAKVEGSAPVFQTTFKSSAISPIVILEYDLDVQTATKFENDLLNMVIKLVLTHSDLTVDVNYTIVHALWRKRQADESVPDHTLNVDITSPTFTDVNFRYATNGDAISASVSIPTAGFLGLQLNYIDQDINSGRFYYRYPTTPANDVDILVFKISKDAVKTNFQLVYNIEFSEELASELKAKLPSIIAAITAFSEKYHIESGVETLKHSMNEAYNVVDNYDIKLSQMSIFFRNTAVQSQKLFQTFLDAAIKFLKETHFKLPGSEEMTTLPELHKKLANSIANVLDKTVQIIHENMEVNYNYFAEKISSVEVQMPGGGVITGRQFIDDIKTEVKELWDEVMGIVKDMDGLDTMLEDIGEILKFIVDEIEEIVDSIEFDYLDDVFIEINTFYREIVIAGKHYVDHIPTLEEFRAEFATTVDNLVESINWINKMLYETIQDNSDHMTLKDGKFHYSVDVDN